MPGRFMALMNETLRRGELEIDGVLELERRNKSICEAGSAGLCQAVRDFESTHELWRGYRSVLRDCISLRKNRGRGWSCAWKRKGQVSTPASSRLIGVACEPPTLSNASVFLLHSISCMYFLSHRVLCLLKPPVYLSSWFVSRIQF